MRIVIVFIAIVCVACATSPRYTKEYLSHLPHNQMPMYGGDLLTSEEKAVNDEFVNTTLASLLTNDAAYGQFLGLGWEYYHKGDLETAIKRFNQAWLFKTDDYEVYWGFGVVLSERGQYEASLALLEKAYGMDETNSRLTSDLAYAYTIRAYQANEKMGPNVRRSFELYAKAKALGGNDGANYYNWSVALYYAEKYVEAKRTLDLAIAAGFQGVEPMYRSELARALRKEERARQGFLY